MRAHATSMITKVMNDSVLSINSLNAMLEICKKNQAVVESHLIMRTWVFSGTAPMSARLKLLTEHYLPCQQLNYSSFLFRTLRGLLEHGLLSGCELSEYPEIWRQVVMALRRPSSRDNAAAFLEAYLLACIRMENDPTGNSGIPQSPRDGHLQNLAVLTTAMGWKCSSKDEKIEKRSLGVSPSMYIDGQRTVV